MERSMGGRAFKDDPAQSARMCLELAPSHCSSCLDFHLSSIMRRSTLPLEKRMADADEFGAAISLALAGILSRHALVRVLIAGSTDTGLYVCLLNAALAAGVDPGEHLAVVLVFVLVLVLVLLLLLVLFLFPFRTIRCRALTTCR